VTNTLTALVAATDAIPMMADDGTTAKNNARDFRVQVLTSLLMPGSSELTVRPGWLPRNYGSGQGLSGKVIQQASPAQSVQMYPGACVVPRSGQGAYITVFEGTGGVVTIPLSAANGTNPRYDRIYSRIYDRGVGDSSGGPSNGGYLEVIEGDPAGSPTIPSIPTDCVPVARILRPANTSNVTTANITDERLSTSLLGAVRQLLPGDDPTTDAGVFPGDIRRNRVTSELEVWDGAGWNFLPGSVPKSTYSHFGEYTLGTTAATQNIPGSTDRAVAVGAVVLSSTPDITVVTSSAATGSIGSAAFQINAAGVYRFGYSIGWNSASNLAGGMESCVQNSDGTGDRYAYGRILVGTNTPAIGSGISGSDEHFFAAGSKISVVVNQTPAASNLAINNVDRRTRFTIRRVTN
jgi:hypothetical protein